MEVIVDRFAATAREGDVYVLNDPYVGGMHLPDIFMVKPIFHAGAVEGYAVVVAHHCDMGGRVPARTRPIPPRSSRRGCAFPPPGCSTRANPTRRCST